MTKGFEGLSFSLGFLTMTFVGGLRSWSSSCTRWLGALPSKNRQRTPERRESMGQTSRRIRKDYGIGELTQCLRTLAAEIHSFREREGLSQADFAKRAKVSKTTVNDLENEVATDLQLSTFLLLCHELDKSPVSFLVASDVKAEPTDLRAFMRAVEALTKVRNEFERLYRKLR